MINNNQEGFVKNKSSADNMRRLLHLIWANRNNSSPISAISLDAQKASDRVDWDFMFTALSKFGFGDGFCRWVRLLYLSPKAAVFTNGILSPIFNISRSTRQRWKLSPLTYDILWTTSSTENKWSKNTRIIPLSCWYVNTKPRCH